MQPAVPSAVPPPAPSNAFQVVAIGAVFWILHELLLLGSIVAWLTVGLSVLGQSGGLQSLLASAYALLGSLVFVCAAALLFGVPFLRSRGGASGLLVAVLFILYGALAAVALALTLLASGALGALDVNGFLSMLQALLGVWALSSIVLVAAALLAPGKASAVGLVSAGKPVFGKALLAYGIVDVVGVLLLTAPLIAAAGGVVSESNAIFAGLGALLSLLVVPILGLIVFALVLSACLRARRAAPAVQGA